MINKSNQMHYRDEEGLFLGYFDTEDGYNQFFGTKVTYLKETSNLAKLKDINDLLDKLTTLVSLFSNQ